MSSDVIDDALSQTGSYVSRALRLFDSYGDREAVVGGGRRLTYRGVRGLVVDLAGVLQRHGIGAGTGVLVLAGNTVELPALQLALHLLGARTMWIAPIAGRTEIEQFAVLFLEETWDAGNCLAVIERERINSTYVSPPLLYQLLDHPALADTDVSSLFMLNVGAGPAAPSRLRQAIVAFGPCLRIVYGLSEVIVVTAQPGLTEDPEHPERLRSSGTPYGDVRVQIRDGEGTPIEPGETGEIWAASRLAFAGYWGRPELTARTIVDGWVRTGDLGFLDEDGYLYVVDRVADTIITGKANWNVYTRPIEDLLAAQPGVRAAAVIGVPDEEYGEVPHAYVVRRAGEHPAAADLAAAVVAEYNEMWEP